MRCCVCVFCIYKALSQIIITIEQAGLTIQGNIAENDTFTNVVIYFIRAYYKDTGVSSGSKCCS